MQTVAITDHVRYRSQESGGVVILDIVAGEWVVLNPTAGELWRSWQAGAGTDQAISHVAEHYPDVPEAAIRADAEQLLSELLARRYVARAEGPAQRSAAAAALAPADRGLAADGGQPVGAAMAAPAAGSSPASSPLGCVVLALISLLAADVLLRCSFRRSVALVALSRRFWCRSAPSAGRASGTVEAVRQAAR